MSRLDLDWTGYTVDLIMLICSFNTKPNYHVLYQHGGYSRRISHPVAQK